MSNLLDKASVILTPTAYNNGEALCVKPSDGSGDFDFSRNSAATRVNAQGLVENVQILSSNLVQNGDFTNGSTDWIVGSDWSIAGNKAVSSGSGNNLQQTISISSNKTYKLTFDVISTSGVLACDLGGATAKTLTDSGSKEYYFQSVNTNNLRFYGSNYYGEITNISVIEITDDTNLPRINYEGFSYDGSGNIVPNSGCGSWLFEPQSTNLVTYSEDLSQWSNIVNVLLESGYLAPDGSNSAYKVTNNGGNAHLAGFIGINTSKHKSIWAKTVSGSGTVNLCNNNSDTNALFTITENWQRFEVTHSGADFFYAVDFRGAGATLSEVIIWGAQLEQQSYATSYIPTSGSTVTRNQDVCNNGGSLATINSTEGTLYFEGSVLANTSTFEVISLSDTTNSNAVAFVYRNVLNQFTAVVKSGGSTSLSKTITLTDATDTIKVAISYKLNEFKFYLNGVLIIADTSGNTPIGLNTLQFTDANGTSNKFFGKTKALAVWKEALSDSELQSLTTI